MAEKTMPYYVKRDQQKNGERRSQQRKRQMCRCEDVKMGGCEDVQMCRCEDVQMGECEDVTLSM
jgi:hypothetical protein